MPGQTDKNELEIAEGARSIEERAEDRLRDLIKVLEGEVIVLPHVKVDRVKILDPLRDTGFEESNPPMIKELRVTIFPPAQDEKKHTPNALRVFQAFKKMILTEMRTLLGRKGKFFRLLQTTKTGKLSIQVVGVRGINARKPELHEYVLPKDAR